MKTQITLLLMSSFLLTGIWLSGSGQTGIADAQAELDKCWQDFHDLEIRANNLRVLIGAYYWNSDGSIRRDLSKDDKERLDRWESEWLKIRWPDRYGNSTWKWVCSKLASAEEDLQRAIEESKKPPTPTPTATPIPSPTPPPYTGPPIEPWDPNLPPISEEEMKSIKGLLDRIDPLSADINDWIKKRKATLPPVKAPDGLETDKRWQPGLQTVSFDMPQGSIVVNLPDDMRAGDTLSGTVTVEPKGRDEQERNQNSTALQNFAIELNMPDTTIVRVPLSTIRNHFAFVTGSNPGNGTVGCTLVTRNGADIANVRAPISPAPPVTPNAKTPRPAKFQFPSLGQQGGSLKIIGPFDGNFKTTEIEIGGQPARVLAESRNSCIVQAPDQISGPVEITVKEGDVEAKGSCRNLGVRLTAPKTSLLRGETTVLTITVEGLKGIQQNVPLLLQKQGVVSMEGGDTQTVQIRPQDVRADGTFETRRTLTGLQAGAFGVTATVIDPAHRPIIIPLTENAKVNGFRVKKEGDTFVLNLVDVQSPVTGKPMDGEHKLEHQCPTLANILYIGRLFLNKGIGKAKSGCPIPKTPRVILEDTWLFSTTSD